MRQVLYQFVRRTSDIPYERIFRTFLNKYGYMTDHVEEISNTACVSIFMNHPGEKVKIKVVLEKIQKEIDDARESSGGIYA